MTLENNKNILEINEVALVKKALKAKKDKCGLLFFQTALVAGGRISEILDLKKEDISLNPDHGLVTFTKTKNKRVRQAYLNLSLAHKLLKHKCNKKASRSQIIKTLIFPHPRISLNVILKTVSEELGGTRIITPHTLRRTFAQSLIAKGYPMNHLQLLLGHENISTTNAYTKVRASINPLKYLLED